MLLRLFLLLAMIVPVTAHAQVRWATKVVDYSSQYDDKTLSAQQVIGEPDQLVSGFQAGGWAPGYRTIRGRKTNLTGEQHITVEFDTVMSIQQVTVVGTGAHAIRSITGFTERGKDVLLFEDTKKEQSLSPNVLRANFEQVDRIKQIKVSVTPDAFSVWPQIDAIGISDDHHKVALPVVGESAMKITRVQPISPEINTAQAEFTDALNSDGSALYFSRGTKGAVRSTAHRVSISHVGVGRVDEIPFGQDSVHAFVGGVADVGKVLALGLGGQIALVGIGNGQFSTPIIQQIDSFYTDAEHFSFCISPDGKSLILALQRADSYGETDLYISRKLSTTGWSAPRNLGREINTVKSEIAPTMSYDGTTLYFSSDGRAGYGGYDIYVSNASGPDLKAWSVARNLSDEVNTPHSEQSFVIDQTLGSAYFTSDRPGGQGSEDIYIAQLPLADTGVTLAGRVGDAETGQAIRARFEVDLMPSRISVVVDSSDPAGKFYLELPYLAKYEVRVTADGYFPVTEYIAAPRYMDERIIQRNFELTPLVAGASITLQGIEFETGSAILRESSHAALDAVLKLLVESPKLRVEIAGHTDDVGDAAANMKLSLERAGSVVQYLVDHGVSKVKLIAKGYGETRPVADNRTSEGRERNRRVEFVVIE